MHRRRGIDRDLLLEDDMQQRGETVAAAAKARHAGAIENGTEHGLPGERLYPLLQMLRRVDQLHSVSPIRRAPAGTACCRHSAAPAPGPAPATAAHRDQRMRRAARREWPAPWP